MLKVATKYSSLMKTDPFTDVEMLLTPIKDKEIFVPNTRMLNSNLGALCVTVNRICVIQPLLKL